MGQGHNNWGRGISEGNRLKRNWTRKVFTETARWKFINLKALRLTNGSVCIDLGQLPEKGMKCFDGLSNWLFIRVVQLQNLQIFVENTGS